MGASSSKAVRGAGRKFPTRAPGAAPPPTPKPAAPSAASQARAAPPPPPPQEDIPAPPTDLDPSDVSPELSARLRQMPIAEPHPTFSPSSRAAYPPTQSLGPDPSLARPSAAPTQSPGGAPVYPSTARNVTLSALEARRALEAIATEEFENLGRTGSTGRQLLDLNTIVQMYLLRDKGVPERQIEERFNLKPGTVAKLGRKGITVPASATDQS